MKGLRIPKIQQKKHLNVAKKIAMLNMKGGCGKSSLSTLLSMAIQGEYSIVTNDIAKSIYDTNIGTKVYKIPRNKKSVPKEWLKLDKIIFDMGAMSSSIDYTFVDVVKVSDVVIIPTKIDKNSLLATIETYEMVKKLNKPVHIIITDYKQKREYTIAKEILGSKGYEGDIHDIKYTTLFRRLSEDGSELFEKVYNNWGEYRLHQSLNHILSLFEKITNIKLQKENLEVPHE